MSRVGLDWYKREPAAYLSDVQGLTTKEHAVYSVVIDLLYAHAGTIRNDPKFISGWISDMGSSAVRKSLASLDANPRITLTITEDEISQKRAKTEAKTKENLRETASKSGKIGGEKSAELRRQNNKNNGLTIAHPSTKIQPDKTRLDKTLKRDTKVSPKKRATRLPDDWVLSKEYGAWALDNGFNESQIRLEAEKFRDYWIGVGGQKGTKRDWLATWRNWMRNTGKTNGTRNNDQQAARVATDTFVDQNSHATAIAISRRQSGA